jgi:hypothetical protein
MATAQHYACPAAEMLGTLVEHVTRLVSVDRKHAESSDSACLTAFIS